MNADHFLIPTHFVCFYLTNLSARANTFLLAS